MRLLTRRSVVLAAVAVLVLAGIVLALVDRGRLALAVAVLLAGLAAVQATRAEASSRRVDRSVRRADEAIRRIERSARRIEKIERVASSQERGIARQGERLKAVQRTVRSTHEKTLESSRALDMVHRRYLNLVEGERLEAARRHEAVLEKVAEGAAIRAELAEQGKRVVREVSELVKAESRQVEAMIHLAPRLDARALLPASGSWALDARSLAHLMDLVEAQRPPLVLELGSGTSTIYLGYLLERWGGRLVSIDHDEHFAARTRAEVSRHGLESQVELRLAPLAEQTIAGSEALWYSLEAFADLEGIGVLLVDGPPGNVAPQSRRHAVPALAGQLAPGALVLLDDAPRPDEQEIVRAWREDYSLEQLDDGVSRIAVLRAR